MKTPQIPIPKMSAALGLTSEVWFKREDKHKYGSQKGRSIPMMIDEAYDTGKTKFVISSSGNAALAAVRAVQSHNRNNKGEKIFLKIFVGPAIAENKLAGLKKEIVDERISIEQVENPKQQAIQMENAGEALYLRQSTSEVALLGYEELANELAKIENLAAVFVPTSSGTTAHGLYLGFQKLGINPQIHIVQTTSCHPMVDASTPGRGNPAPTVNDESSVVTGVGAGFPRPSTKDEPSIATAIVDKVALRKEALTETIKNSRGNGWVATNDDIIAAMKLAKETSDLSISPNAALAVAGLMLAVKNGCTWDGPIVCLITGL